MHSLEITGVDPLERAHSVNALKVAFVCAAAATTSCTACGELASDDAGLFDAASDQSFVGCPLPRCYGIIDLPVGVRGQGDDGCSYACVEAGAPACVQAGSCACAPNPCDGSPGSCACLSPPPAPGPGCVIPTCSGAITLPRGTSTFSSVAGDGGWTFRNVTADGCTWFCQPDGSTYCAQPVIGSCNCGVSICDAGAD